MDGEAAAVVLSDESSVIPLAFERKEGELVASSAEAEVSELNIGDGDMLAALAVCAGVDARGGGGGGMGLREARKGVVLARYFQPLSTKILCSM